MNTNHEDEYLGVAAKLWERLKRSTSFRPMHRDIVSFSSIHTFTTDISDGLHPALTARLPAPLAPTAAMNHTATDMPKSFYKNSGDDFD